MVNTLLANSDRTFGWFYRGTLADTRSQRIMAALVQERINGAQAVVDEINKRSYKGVEVDRIEWQGMVDDWKAILEKGNAASYTR